MNGEKQIQKCLILGAFVLLLMIQGRNTLDVQCEIVSSVEYQCCLTIKYIPIIPKNYCQTLKILTEEVGVELYLKADSIVLWHNRISLYHQKICPKPFVCLEIFTNLTEAIQVCSKLTVASLNVVKFPCIVIKDGQFSITENNQ